MKISGSPQFKVGLFVVVVFVLLVYVTVRVTQSSIFPGSTYTVYFTTNSATGLNNKTPVQIAGIQVGNVDEVKLVDSNKAQITLEIKKDVELSRDVQARVKSVGFLGDTYIDLYQPGPVVQPFLRDGESITSVGGGGDFGEVTTQVSDIAADIKAITATMKTLMAGEDSSFARTLKNVEKITTSLEHVTTQNEGNLNAIIANMKALSENMNLIVARNTANIDATLDNVASISEKVRRGEGTVGRLLNDDETVEKLNESLDNLNGILGGANKLQTSVGYHAEYLGVSKDFKHYISLALKPRPDKYFLLEFISDPSPDSRRETVETEITANGVTSTVVEEKNTTSPDNFLISAQLAKEFYGFTLRGGVIESKGGVGIDYTYGPASLKTSVFDFETKHNERPHIKTMATFNVTDSFYLLGGLDDIISKQQDPDWFLGLGIQVSDEDIKSLFGLMSLKN